jgi:hypothetical protein
MFFSSYKSTVAEESFQNEVPRRRITSHEKISVRYSQSPARLQKVVYVFHLYQVNRFGEWESSYLIESHFPCIDFVYAPSFDFVY